MATVGNNNNQGRYMCTVPGCARTYSAQGTLNAHVQAAHNGARWNCRNCGMPFMDPGNRNRHERARHQDERFACDMCLHKDRRSDNFKRHLRSAHQLRGGVLDAALRRCDRSPRRRAGPLVRAAPSAPAFAQQPLVQAAPILAAPAPPAPAVAQQPLPPVLALGALPVGPAQMVDPLLTGAYLALQYPADGFNGVGSSNIGSIDQQAPPDYGWEGFLQEQTGLAAGYQPTEGLFGIGDRQGQQQGQDDPDFNFAAEVNAFYGEDTPPIDPQLESAVETSSGSEQGEDPFIEGSWFTSPEGVYGFMPDLNSMDF